MKFVHTTDTHLVAPRRRLYGLDPKARPDAAVADIKRRHDDAERVVVTVQNIILACRALGLGTTITTNHIRCEEGVKAVLGIPEHVQTFAMMPIGYPLDKFGPLVRRPVAEVAHADHWSRAWPGTSEN